MSAVRALFASFRDLASLRRLAFLASPLVLAGVWLGLLIALWSIVVALAITPLVVPALVAIGYAVHGCSLVETWLTRALLGADVRASPAPTARGFWRRGWVVLSDGATWRAQAYLALRATFGFALAIALIAALAAALYLIAGPAFFWALPEGELGVHGYRVTTLPEALSLVPVGLLSALALAHALGPLAAPWRRLSLALLDRGPATSPSPGTAASSSPGAATASSPRAPGGADSRAASRQALAIHATVAGAINVVMIAIWALTSRTYFWPMWTLLVLALPLALHAIVEVVEEHRAYWRRQRLDEGFAIHAGVWLSLLLFLTGVWGASGGGYFWPVWVLLIALIALGAHAAPLLIGSHEDRAALTERISALESSRAGAVDVQESELRRIERDLHDGAQARLVALGMSLGMAEQKLADERDPDAARALLAEARAGAGEALRELRDLARGIHPPVLADRGLEAAVRALAAVSPISVTVSVTLPSRPKPPVESAAYFVVAEALANAGKHAHATRVDVRVVRDGERLSVEVHDDGGGDADPSGGGLSGLRRRVQALDGTLSVVSPPGGPTTIRAELPCE